MENNQSIYPNFSNDFKDSNPTFVEPCFSETIKPEIQEKQPSHSFCEPYSLSEQTQHHKSQPQQNEKNNLLSSILPLLLSGQNSANQNNSVDFSSILNMTKGSSSSSALLQTLLSSGEIFKKEQPQKKVSTDSNEKIDVSKLTKIDI